VKKNKEKFHFIIIKEFRHYSCLSPASIGEEQNRLLSKLQNSYTPKLLKKSPKLLKKSPKLQENIRADSMDTIRPNRYFII